MIRVDAVWLAVEPLDMRAGTDTALVDRAIVGLPAALTGRSTAAAAPRNRVRVT